MARPVRSGALARFAFAVSIVLASVAGAVGFGAVTPGATMAVSLPAWTGSVDLYRSGVFTTQQTWLWCTAADVQIIRNIADRQADHSKAAQQRYFDYMRTKDRYAIPVSDGTDPGGWTAGLRHFVDSRYTLYTSPSFDSALRSAVTNLRQTNLPVAITVDHGNHAWIITGFKATADPARTSDFTVTSVSVVGPLWGLQSRTYGYDMKPDTTLTPKQLASFFTPWHYARIRMAWEGRWVSIQPVLARPAAPVAPATRRPAPSTHPVMRHGAPAARVQPVPSNTPSGGAAPAAVNAATAVATSLAAVGPVGPSSSAQDATPPSLAWLGLALGVGAGLGTVAVVAIVARHRRHSQRSGIRRPVP